MRQAHDALARPLVPSHGQSATVCARNHWTHMGRVRVRSSATGPARTATRQRRRRGTPADASVPIAGCAPQTTCALHQRRTLACQKTAALPLLPLRTPEPSTLSQVYSGAALPSAFQDRHGVCLPLHRLPQPSDGRWLRLVWSASRAQLAGHAPSHRTVTPAAGAIRARHTRSSATGASYTARSCGRPRGGGDRDGPHHGSPAAHASGDSPPPSTPAVAHRRGSGSACVLLTRTHTWIGSKRMYTKIERTNRPPTKAALATCSASPGSRTSGTQCQTG